MTVEPSDEPTAQPLARCYRHPLRETGVRCVRCERPICPECMRPASVGFHCPDDVKLARVTQRRPRTIAGAPVDARPPVVTWSLVALNVAIYLITGVTSHDGLNRPSSSWLFAKWDLVPVQAAAHEYYRLLTSAFLHESLLHIAANMLALALIGPHLERLLGMWRFGLLYLISALGGGIAVYLFDSKYISVVGASGAIFGLFAAALLYVRELGFDPRSLAATIVLNFILTITIPNISLLSHIGGFIAGGVVAFVYTGVPWQRRRLPMGVQLFGIAGVLVVLFAAAAWRSVVI